MSGQGRIIGNVPVGRLAAEFVVIVMGVLVALAVDAALEVREEERREQAYYRALARDLVLDLQEYDFSLRMSARSLNAAWQVRATILGEPSASDRPLAESVEYASWVNYPGWASGTIDELFSAGTIRLIRDPDIKDGIHAYRTEVAEWAPRIQGREFSAHLAYRELTRDIVPLEQRIAYWSRSLDDPPADATGDDTGIAARLAGDQALLRTVEQLILEWTAVAGVLERQRSLAAELLARIEAR